MSDKERLAQRAYKVYYENQIRRMKNEGWSDQMIQMVRDTTWDQLTEDEKNIWRNLSQVVIAKDE